MKKKVMRVALFSMIMAMFLSVPAFAQENKDSARTIEPKDVKTVEQLGQLAPEDVNREVLEQVGTVDYYNSDTGEYFVWEDEQSGPTTRAATVAKKFSFKIASSVTTKGFTIKSTQAKVKMTKADVVNQNGYVYKSAYDGYKYCIDVYKTLLKKTMNLYVHKQATGMVDGLAKGKTYYLTVRNPGTFDGAGAGTRYLKGNGTLYNI